ncbi:papain family cysteine protease domain-containing protein [Ditylenchus destructor]|uniref:Papain family cysteine protease domain-containing protein n=1 Tax=Ditylenchus destructor TaxID=166010 RepID=A0AAD4MKI8_9BILA|nr:papain family cysteine protease domain-containing protein [Ditylenchus destructor]
MEYKSHLGATSFLLPFILAILCTSLISDVIAPKVTTTQGATKTGQKKIKIDDNISWEDYKKIYGKKYSPGDDKEHKGAFEKIKAIVKAHNANPHKKFTMALNAKADRTKKEKMAHGKRQRQAGYHSVKSEQPKTRTKRSPTIYPTEYPANFDWTEPKNSSIYVTPVRDQGETGYCWALASADVLTMQYRRRSGDSAILSPQAIIDCASKEPKEGAKSGPDEDDSDGGFETDAFNYANEIQGLPTDKTYPLTPREEISDADLEKEIFIVVCLLA